MVTVKREVKALSPPEGGLRNELLRCGGKGLGQVILSPIRI